MSAIVACGLSVGLAAFAGATEIIAHDARVRFVLDEARIEVVDRTTLDEAGTIDLRLAEQLTIERAETARGEAMVIALSPGRWRIRAAPDDGSRLTIHFGGRLRSRTEDAPGTAPVVDPEGVYLPGGAAWLPQTDARALYRVQVQTPEGQIAVASLPRDGGADGIVFMAKVPGEEPTLLMGPYRVGEAAPGRAKGIALRTYFHAEVADLSAAYLDAAGTYLARFSRRIGPYPYRAFSVVSAALPVGLGFPGIAYVSRAIVPMPFMRERSLAHEILHNWWGHGVRPDYQFGNWSEGLTTYMADYALAEEAGAAEAGAEKGRDMRLGWLRDLAALPGERDMPVVRFTERTHAASQVVGYGKVAAIFVMLEDEIGMENVADGLRRFWTEHRGGTAAWADLRRAFESAAGRPLASFFDQWLLRRGAPRLRLGSVGRVKAGEGWRISATLRQEGDDYDLAVPVRIRFEDGAENRVVRMSGPELHFTIDTGARPLEISVDPEFRLYRYLAGGEAAPIMRDVTLDARTQVLLPGDDGDALAAAEALSARLLDDGGIRVRSLGQIADDAPVLMIGTTEEVARWTAAIGVAYENPAVMNGGDARAWTVRGPAGQPILVVSGGDGDALRSLLRPLPHYGGKGFVVFEKGRAVDSGAGAGARQHALKRPFNDSRPAATGHRRGLDR